MLLALHHCTIDLDTRRVIRHDGEEHTLTSREWQLLAYMAEREGQTVTLLQLEREVWHLSSTAMSRAVSAAMLRLRRKIEEDPARPSSLVTVYGEGWTLRGVAKAPDAVQVPVESTRPQVARASLHAAVDQLLRTSNRVVLTGLGGIGKSTLAKEVVAERPETALWVACHDTTTTEDLARASSNALFRRNTDIDQVQRTFESLSSTIVILDDADHLAPAAWRWLSQSVAPETTILATARTPPPVAGWSVVHVGPLSLQRPPGSLSPAACVLVDPNVAGSDDKADAYEHIAQHFGGHPLALRMLHNRIQLMGVDAVLTRIDAIDATLSDHTQAQRHQVLDDVLASTLHLLRPHEREFLQRLAWWPGPIAPSVLAHLTADGAPPTLATIERLRDAGWLLPVAGHESRDLLPTVCRRHLQRMGTPDTATLQHLVDALDAHFVPPPLWGPFVCYPSLPLSLASLQSLVITALTTVPSDAAARVALVAADLSFQQGELDNLLRLCKAVLHSLVTQTWHIRARVLLSRHLSEQAHIELPADPIVPLPSPDEQAALVWHTWERAFSSTTTLRTFVLRLDEFIRAGQLSEIAHLYCVVMLCQAHRRLGDWAAVAHLSRNALREMRRLGRYELGASITIGADERLFSDALRLELLERTRTFQAPAGLKISIHTTSLVNYTTAYWHIQKNRPADALPLLDHTLALWSHPHFRARYLAVKHLQFQARMLLEQHADVMAELEQMHVHLRDTADSTRLLLLSILTEVETWLGEELGWAGLLHTQLQHAPPTQPTYRGWLMLARNYLRTGRHHDADRTLARCRSAILQGLVQPTDQHLFELTDIENSILETVSAQLLRRWVALEQPFASTHLPVLQAEYWLVGARLSRAFGDADAGEHCVARARACIAPLRLTPGSMLGRLFAHHSAAAE